MTPLLTLRDVRFGFPSIREFLGPISVAVQPGQLWAIVGPNGAGKSTLLRLMAGLLPVRSGEVQLEGRALGMWSRRERGKRIAFVPQQSAEVDEVTAREWVLLGRYPHRSLGLFESSEDERACDRAMEMTDVRGFAGRAVRTLSGGEFQRVRLAAALAQRPRLLLLDEPTASLDLQHQLAIFELLRNLVREEQLGAVAVTHDVNLALRFCGKVLLLHQGRSVACGDTCHVLTPDVLRPVYAVALTALSDSSHPECRWIVPVGINPTASS